MSAENNIKLVDSNEFHINNKEEIKFQSRKLWDEAQIILKNKKIIYFLI